MLLLPDWQIEVVEASYRDSFVSSVGTRLPKRTGNFRDELLLLPRARVNREAGPDNDGSFFGSDRPVCARVC